MEMVSHDFAIADLFVSTISPLNYILLAAVNGRSAAYVAETLVPTSSSLLNRARLRSSASGAFDVSRVRTQFDRTFHIAGPVAWNELPVALRTINNIACFMRNLMARLFRAAYNC